jgi:hypothetical protein
LPTVCPEISFAFSIRLISHLAYHTDRWPDKGGSTSITTVINTVFRPINCILALVLSVVRAAVWPITDAVPALFAMILLVIDTISGIIYGIVPSLDTSAHAGRENYWLGSLLACPLCEARQRRWTRRGCESGLVQARQGHTNGEYCGFLYLHLSGTCVFRGVH